MGSLANRFRQGRDLRRVVHGLHSYRRIGAAGARRGGDPRTLRAGRRSAWRRARLSARQDDHQQRRWNAAVLRPTWRRLPRSARRCARRRGGPRTRARLCRRPFGLQRGRSLPGDVCRWRALLWQRSISASTRGSSFSGERRKLQSWRLYALGVLLGGLVAGALGWYFDTAQVQVVVAKFWAYADVDYRLDGRAISDFTTYPIFNKYGTINLGQVAGGTRLFWTESRRRRHQLVARGAAVLDQLRAARCGAAKKPKTDNGSGQRKWRGSSRGAGRAGVALGPVDGANHQLVPAPVAGSQLVQPGWRGAIGGRHRRGRLAESRRTSAGSASPCSPVFSPMIGFAS